MIGRVTGAAKDAGKGLILVETSGGVGYTVRVTATTKNTMLGQKTCALQTHTMVRNDGIELFGFLNQEEYSSFLLLLTVSGIGPKKALGILETIPTKTLLQAIQKEDLDILISFGMGRKQAQRIVLELQRKIETVGVESGISGDVITAMVALGYDKKEVVEVLRETRIPDGTTEEQIQETLRAMRKQTTALQ